MKILILFSFLLIASLPLKAQLDVFGTRIPDSPKRVSLPDSPNFTDSNGKKQGEWSKKYDNGYYKYKANFKDDKPVGEMTRFYENGKKSVVIVYRADGRGAASLFDEAENLIAEGIYNGTARDSVWRFYDEKSVLKSTEPYSNGVINGVVSIFYPEGVLSEEITYVNGVKHGPWKRYSKSGTVQLDAGYKNGNLDGRYRTYNANGICDVTGIYVNGVQEGDWKVFDSEKNEDYTLKYKNGVLLNASEIDKRMEKKLAEYESKRKMLKDPEVYRNDPEGYLSR